MKNSIWSYMLLMWTSVLSGLLWLPRTAGAQGGGEVICVNCALQSACTGGDFLRRESCKSVNKPDKCLEYDRVRYSCGNNTYRDELVFDYQLQDCNPGEPCY